MRPYQQDNTSLASIDGSSAQTQSYLNSNPVLTSVITPPAVPPYTPDTYNYGTAHHSYSNVSVPRPSVPSNISTSLSSPGMHGHRSGTLPHPGNHRETRDTYVTTTPGLNRRDHHHYLPRSPSSLYTGIRQQRHPLNPLAPPGTSSTYSPHKMDSTYGAKAQANIPPLNPLQTLGSLTYQDATQTAAKIEINGIIDKGFFLADEQWTCYRRNYFSCVCSYSLTPNLMVTEALQFTPTGGQQTYTVFGFAMSISAMVADTENQSIDLVQHTPKRDKGPVAKPEKIRLSPKPNQPAHHPLSNIYGGPDGMGSSRGYGDGYGQAQNSTPSEHTFERIQFKQATANNGKRRAAQQYYHLIVELWADVGPQPGVNADGYIKIAFRKSAKMIVRGRSPGHYQSERRGSTSSGPGGSGGGSIAGGGYTSNLMGGADYSNNTSLLPGGFTHGYDPRSGYGSRHHHELALEPMISAEEEKGITAPKGYHYYPQPFYEGEQADPRNHQVEMFSHTRGEPEHTTSASLSSGYEKVKPEEGLPSIFFPGSSYYSGSRCGRFEGKPSSNGYYPTPVPPSSLNMT